MQSVERRPRACPRKAPVGDQPWSVLDKRTHLEAVVEESFAGLQVYLLERHGGAGWRNVAAKWEIPTANQLPLGKYRPNSSYCFLVLPRIL